nr:DUF393 domain-containing protein [Geothrix fuzhouensis]
MTRLFYDGGCGLCHAAVRFVARHDVKGHIRFAPLGGETFLRLIPAVGSPLPDSLVVLTPESRLLVRSEAVIHLLICLGGSWGLWAALLKVVPRSLCDGLYDLVAKVRRHLFRPPAGVCPVLPTRLRDRFDP